MQLIQNIPFISIMLSILAGVFCFASKAKLAERLTLGALAAITLMSAALLAELWQTGESFIFSMGHFPAPWGNELRAGVFEALMALAFSVVMLLSLIAGRERIYDDIAPARQGLYFLMINLLMSSLLALIYTNDLFTAYVFVEINTLAACAIVASKDTGETITATIRYLIMSLLGSGMLLIAISLIYSVTGHLLMDHIRASLEILAAKGSYEVPLAVVILLISVGLAIKSALYPFHTWLPTAHGSATTASSAILSGVVLKGYVILLLKIFYRVFGLEFIHQLQVANLLFAFGLAGMIFGSLYALREHNIKRLLAYSSVAQVGYIFMGIGLSTATGTVAACFHILAHAIPKPMLFCAADGLMETSGHSRQIHDLKSAGHKNRLAGLAFTAGSLSMIGIPLFSGFVSKFYFATASLESPGKMVMTLLVLALSTLLNAMYFVPVIVTIYAHEDEGLAQGEELSFADQFIPEAEPEETGEPPLVHKSPVSYKLTMILFILLNIFLGCVYGPVLEIIERGLLMF